MPDKIEALLRDVLTKQTEHNIKIESVIKTIEKQDVDLKQVRDHFLETKSYRESHERTHAWLNRGILAIFGGIIVTIVTNLVL